MTVEQTTRLDWEVREMKAEIRANIEKFEVLLGTLISWMDIHQAMTEANQREMLTKMDDKTDINQKRL
jgi:predicted glycoside hydrolase/deacetylase ChbG (UPF0249 family)